MLSKYIISTNVQKVLNYLLAHPNTPFYERDIARKAGISNGSANSVLNRLFKEGILHRKAKAECITIQLTHLMHI